MPEINLIFEIHCQRPPWAIENPYKLSSQIGVRQLPFSKSKYRIYVNDDLITERTWIWDNSTFLKENIWIISSTNNNTLKIEPIIDIPEQAKFNIDNFQIANNNADTSKINDLQVNFILR